MPHFNALTSCDPCKYRHINDISLKLDYLGYSPAAESIGRVSSTTFAQWAPKATEFGEITQNNGHYAVQGPQGHRFWYQSKAHKCDFLLVINTILPHILHRFQVTADYWSNFR